MVGGAPEFEGEMMDTRFKSAKVVLVKVRSELGAFAHHSGHLTLWGVRVASTMVR